MHEYLFVLLTAIAQGRMSSIFQANTFLMAMQSMTGKQSTAVGVSVGKYLVRHWFSRSSNVPEHLTHAAFFSPPRTMYTKIVLCKSVLSYYSCYFTLTVHCSQYHAEQMSISLARWRSISSRNAHVGLTLLPGQWRTLTLFARCFNGKQA